MLRLRKLEHDVGFEVVLPCACAGAGALKMRKFIFSGLDSKREGHLWSWNVISTKSEAPLTILDRSWERVEPNPNAIITSEWLPLLHPKKNSHLSLEHGRRAFQSSNSQSQRANPYYVLPFTSHSLYRLTASSQPLNLITTVKGSTWFNSEEYCIGIQRNY